jgi:hypothetical protein
MKAFKDAPLRSTNDYQIGFYDIGIMRELMDSVDASEFRVATMPVPTNVFDRAEVEKIISHPSVEYALVDKNKIVAVSLKGSTGWMSALKKAGYKVKGGGKTSKRLKTAHRASLINMHFDSVNIKWANPTDYTRFNFDSGWAEWVEEATPRLLDGGFVVSSRLIRQAVEAMPIYDSTNTADENDVYYDPKIQADLRKFLIESRVFNGRLLFEDGMIKGNFFVSDNLPEGVDVITTRDNVKKELSYTGGFRLIAEPQGPKSRVVTDDQTVINFPKLFRKADMEMWLKEDYEKMFQDAINGRLLTNWKSYFVRQFSRDNKEVEDVEAQARIGYVGYRWASMGLSITDSPWLFKTLAISHAKPLENRIPIPCSVYEQVIPESLARMGGWEIEVEEGTIRRLNDIGVHVVNDFDWLEMYESHGGHDEDDFFKLFYRTLTGGTRDGEKVVIIARSPNGYGEYSILSYVEDEWYPTWSKANGEVISFPEVNGKNWPVRLSYAIRNKQVKYLGLPSDHDPQPPRQSGAEYSVEDVMADIDTAMMGGNVGRFVNASMLHSSTIGKHRPVQVCSLESAIDGCTQTSDARDRQAIDAEAETIIQEVLNSGRPVDHDLWHGRFKNLARKHPEVETYSGTLTHLNNLCKHYNALYVDRVTKYSQENIELSPTIQALGERLYYHAGPILRNFRMNIYNTNSNDYVQTVGAIKREEWDYLYKFVVNAINSFERIEDQHDFVIALYCTTIKEPTSTGKLSDQIVMNRTVYPYLEKALIHYGIGKRVIMQYENGEYKLKTFKHKKWVHTDPDGTEHVFTDVLEYQKHHAQYSPIVFTNVQQPAPVRRLKAEF